MYHNIAHLLILHASTYCVYTCLIKLFVAIVYLSRPSVLGGKDSFGLMKGLDIWLKSKISLYVAYLAYYYVT